MTKNLPDDIKYAVETLKGGKGSGNWGHGGLAGVHGGSSPTKGGNVASLSNNLDNFKKYVESAVGFSFEDGNNHQVRSAMKDKIARELVWAVGSGVDYGDTNNMMTDWAETSNKTYEAYLMQRAVSEEMGVPLSDWQKDRFAFYDFAEKQRYDLVEDLTRTMLTKLPKEVSASGDNYPSYSDFYGVIDRWRWDKQRELKEQGIEVAIDVDYLAFSGRVIVRFENMNQYLYGKHGSFGGRFQEEIPFKSIDSEEDYAKSMKGLKGWMWDGLQRLKHREQERMDKNRGMAKAIYRKTQQILKEVFPNATHLVLYRGINDFDFDSEKYQQNAMEAWSLDPRTAADFGEGRYPFTLLKAVVPIKNVFSTCLSGMGCLAEYEVVALPGNYKISIEKHDSFGGLENMLPEDVFD